ncbi:NUDIX domain-containing protein [Marivivens aquimaris]|uniref:NUDIX domain-containing protein n=1 Tax=Marivivens aquimaris TaxID=2774876 RepID=UPI00187F5974|nr:NUDIX domain-containing protein [Marivivens aquimaris]
MKRPIRLATRAIIMNENKLLIVNAWRGRTHLWCAPGGGAEPHQSLPANLSREVFEETGITVKVGEPCLVNEFHDPDGDFHQVDIYFRCEIVSGDLYGEWTDPEGVVSHRRWVSRSELSEYRLKPDSLAAVAWRDPDAPAYDALEPILR